MHPSQNKSPNASITKHFVSPKAVNIHKVSNFFLSPEAFTTDTSKTKENKLNKKKRPSSSSSFLRAATTVFGRGLNGAQNPTAIIFHKDLLHMRFFLDVQVLFGPL